MRVFVGGVLKEYREGSMSLDLHVSERSSASFTLVHLSSEHFDRHVSITIEDDLGTVLFCGFLEEPVESPVDNEVTTLHTSVRAIDCHYLADKRLIPRAYLDTDAGTIVRDIVDDFLSEEGVTQGTIEDGPAVTRAIFDYVPASEAIGEIATRANFVWYIDENKALHFHARNAIESNNTVRLTDTLSGSVSVGRGATTYRNRQFIRGARGKTTTQVENFEGDGTIQAWPLQYPIAELESVTLNTVAQTVEKKSVEGTTAPFLYELDDPILAQRTSETPLTPGDNLVVTYKGWFDFIGFAEDTSLQSDLLSREGSGTGIVERVTDDETMDSIEATSEKASQLLGTFGREVVTVKFATRRSDLTIGTVITADFPEHDVNSLEVLIESITITEYAGNPDLNAFRYQVEAIAGPSNDSWISWWKRLMGFNEDIHRAIAIGADFDTVTVLAGFCRDWLEDELPEMFEIRRPSVTLFPGSGIRPGYDPDGEVRFVALGDGTPGPGGLGNEVFRKAVSALTGTRTDLLNSISILGASEANFAITEIAWFGGESASTTPGTGVLLEALSYVHTKNSGEVLQINRCDRKGY